MGRGARAGGWAGGVGERAVERWVGGGDGVGRIRGVGGGVEWGWGVGPQPNSLLGEGRIRKGV